MHKSNDTYMSPYTYHPAATHSHHRIHFHTRTHTRLCFRSHLSSSVMFSLWKCILWLRTCDYVCVQRGEESCWISKLDQGHWHTHTECLATAVSQFSLCLSRALIVVLKIAVLILNIDRYPTAPLCLFIPLF